MYGIDFGTSNTVMCTTNKYGGVDLLEIGRSTFVVPTLLYLEKSGKVSIGQEAICDYTNALEKWSLEDNPYDYFRFIQAPKLAIKDPRFIGTKIFERIYSPEEIVGLFLSEIKMRADRITGRDEKMVVIGRPVQFSNNSNEDVVYEERMRRAAKIAGFEEISFVFEPVGAAMSSISSLEGKGIVFDFGGGTLDISVVEYIADDCKVLSNVGGLMGGYNLSEEIAKARIAEHFGMGSKYETLDGKVLQIPHHLTSQIYSFYSLPLSNISATRKNVKELIRFSQTPKTLIGLDTFLAKNKSFELFQTIDTAKIQLSNHDQATISYSLQPYISFREIISRNSFEEMLSDYLMITSNLIEEALGKANVVNSEIDFVVRVGGSSQIPLFVHLLNRLFPGKVIEGDIFSSIAAGLIKAHQKGYSK